VLGRRVGEEIVIGGNIRIFVVAIRGQQVRLGITAPKSVPVARAEILVRGVELAVKPPQEGFSEGLLIIGATGALR